MKRPTPILAVILTIIFGWSGSGFGQQAGQPVPEESQSVPAAEAQQAIAAELSSASPLPGEEVMRPTGRGVRFTREMARGFSRILAKGALEQELALGPEQKDQMVECMTRRFWDLNVRMGREGCEAIECFLENVIQHDLSRNKKVSPDKAQEFSRRVRPGIKIVDEFWRGLVEDARPIMDKEQYGRFEKLAAEVFRTTRQFDEKMDRWSRGEVKDQETVLDGLENDFGGTAEEGKPREYVQAERRVRWEIDLIGPTGWREYLNRLTAICRFDEAQKQAGRKLLDKYCEKAKSIMNAQWRARTLANRVRRQLEGECPKEPLAPYSYRLDRDYKQMVEPIQAMGREFHRDVLALATPEQRDRLFGQLRKIGTDHGMRPEEMEGLESWLAPPQSQLTAR